MFKYFHCYMEETWDAQVKAGLIDENSGIRFPQSLGLYEKDKFNNVAKAGGKLWSMLKENSMPFYIDRLQGGCYIENYNYDMELINSLKEMLGDNFWGFQMHEWMSNFFSDIVRLRSNGCPHIGNTRGWSKEDIIATIKRAYPFPHLFLESHTAEEMAEIGDPETFEEFFAHAQKLFKKRQKYTEGMLIPCDSFYLAMPLELKNGAKRIMPEIGAQTPDTRIQVCYARGMAKAYGVSFGTYYEPWGGDPFSACNYHKEGKNEWNIQVGADFPFETKGNNGGSSRSMQRRMQLYSYIAGAQFISEEWGMCNTFYDWEEFELTPYGKIKLDFINFTRKYPDVGSTIVPVAVVLPADLQVLEGVRKEDDSLCGFPIFGSFAEKVRKVRKGLRRLFLESSGMKGTETTSLINSNIPDAIDIVHEDRFDADSYEYLVDLTGNSSFAEKYASKICAAEDVQSILSKLLPCRVEGGLHHLVNRMPTGKYSLMIFNHSGVSRTVAEGERFMHEEDKTVTVTCKDNRRINMLEGNGSVTYEGDVAYVTVPAGGWFFAEF